MSTSPYYFVPFAPDGSGNEPVFCPADAELVSHDHPYRDGLCGHLEIELEATTPIYIRNSGDHRDYRDGGGFAKDAAALLKSHPEGKCVPAREYARMPNFRDFVSFYQLGSRPAIPGTSIKGVIRSVLQIITKGRCEPFNNRRYSMRDLDSPDYKSWFKGGPHAGFVRWDPARCRYRLIPCKFAKILQKDLEDDAAAKHPGKPGALSLGEPQTAEDKYRAWLHNLKMPYQFDVYVNGDEARLRSWENAQKTNATVVFVGQTARREGNETAKKREYVFYDLCESAAVDIDDEIWQGFLDAHEDTNRVPADSWAYWKSQIQENPALLMPVFYLTHETTRNGSADTSRCLIAHPGAKLHSLGLSKLYRLPHRMALHDAIPRQHRPPEPTDDTPAEGTDPYPCFQPDFPSLLLGEARQHRSLRGRVSFGHLVRAKSNGSLPTVITVLGGPKPTFYPNYMVDGRTLMQPNARFRGWKFYAAREDGSSPVHAPLPTSADDRPNLKVATSFEPLPAGTVFKGTVRFHNLRPHELGAIVWALVWGGRDECRHRIGMAKPLGYGCTRISLRGGEVIPNAPAGLPPGGGAMALNGDAIRKYSADFEKWLADQPHMTGWLDGKEVRTLLALARHDHGVPKKQLAYPVLDPAERRDDFKVQRQGGGVLPDWLDLVGELPDFTLWPERMLPRETRVLETDAFPGDELLVDAHAWEPQPQEGKVYRCRIVSVAHKRFRIRVLAACGAPDSAGGLTVVGPDAVRLLGLATVGREIAVIYESGGNSSRNFKLAR